MSGGRRQSYEIDGILADNFDVASAVGLTAVDGYCFWPDAFTDGICKAMEVEVESLGLRSTDRRLLNEGTAHEVRQSHEKAYFPVGAAEIPVATLVNQAIARRVQETSASHPELAGWEPTEAGYQRYRDSDDGISPHRDSKTDQLLAATITVNGSSPVRIYEPKGAPDDYSDLELIEEYHTAPGSLMLLRAPGLGSGERTIHEALPPGSGSRTVLNLRMRADTVRPSERT